VPEPLSPRSRSRVGLWDRGAGASVRQSYRTLTIFPRPARVLGTHLVPRREPGPFKRRAPDLRFFSERATGLGRATLTLAGCFTHRIRESPAATSACCAFSSLSQLLPEKSYNPSSCMGAQGVRGEYIEHIRAPNRRWHLPKPGMIRLSRLAHCFRSRWSNKRWTTRKNEATSSGLVRYSSAPDARRRLTSLGVARRCGWGGSRGLAPCRIVLVRGRLRTGVSSTGS
jgi:hypothetical protein